MKKRSNILSVSPMDPEDVQRWVTATQDLFGRIMPEETRHDFDAATCLAGSVILGEHGSIQQAYALQCIPSALMCLMEYCEAPHHAESLDAKIRTLMASGTHPRLHLSEDARVFFRSQIKAGLAGLLEQGILMALCEVEPGR